MAFMKLSDLKKLVPVAEEREKVPTIFSLVESDASVVARDLISADTDVTVYSNGYVLYRAGDHATVFPLHECMDYRYEYEGQAPVIVPEEVFDAYNWSVRLVAEGEDRLEYNQRQKWKRTTFSYSGAAEDWAILADVSQDAETMLIEREYQEERKALAQTLLRKLTEHQRFVVIECVVRGRQHKDVAKQLGTSRQAVTDALKKAMNRMKKEYGKM